MKAVIPAAGLGTRFLPATKSTPKEMLPVVDKPAIQYVVEEALDAGIDDILIITGRGKHSIADYFDMSYELEHTLRQRNDHERLATIRRIADMADIHYIRQKQPRGLGDAINCARKHVDGDDFAVLLGDDIIFSEQPCTGQLVDRFQSCKAPVIAVGQVPREAVHRYGIVDAEPVGERLYRIRDLVEKPSMEEAPSRLAIMGRYVFTPEIFDYIEQTTRGKGGEIQLTDAIRMYNRDSEVYAYEFEGRRFDLGNKLDWLRTNVEAALRRDEFREDMLRFLRRKVAGEKAV
ncbi:MAG: UTP--glucose-1-phosphate uridylyltransferase GalU [Thermoplasmatota archaeon]